MILHWVEKTLAHLDFQGSSRIHLWLVHRLARTAARQVTCARKLIIHIWHICLYQNVTIKICDLNLLV